MYLLALKIGQGSTALALWLLLLVGVSVSAAATADERPQTLIGTALQAGEVRSNADGTFSVDLEIRLQNVGIETLVEVQVFSDLAADLAPATVVSIDNLVASGALSVVSDTFDGDVNRFMLPGIERMVSDLSLIHI